MEAPLCEVCLKSDMLCPGCAEKIEKGIISEDDVMVARIIYKLSKDNKDLKELSFLKTINTNNLLLIVVERGESENFIKKSGKLLKSLSKKLRKKVRVIEETDELKDLSRDLLRPSKVLGINILYGADGDMKYKVSLAKIGKKLPASKGELEKLLESFSGKKVKIEF